jgi:hypothetical protein
MIKTKGIIAVGVILLFMGVAFSSASAQPITKEQLQASTLGDLASLRLSAKDQTAVEKFLPELFEKMQTTTSFSELANTIQSMINEHGRNPVLVLILTLIMKVWNFQYKFGQWRPVRHTAFIMSYGFTNKIISLAKNKVVLAKPFTAWYYSGKSDLIVNSRTIILDLYPFSVRMLTGRQIGMMSNFIGIYIHFSGSLSDKAKTFFLGYAGTIRGFDLSPMNN